MQYCTVAFTSHTRARSTLQSLQSRGLDRRPTAFKTMRYTNRQPLPFFFTFSEVTADWHELMIQEPVLRLPCYQTIRLAAQHADIPQKDVYTSLVVLLMLQYGIMVGIGVSLLMLLSPWRKPKVNVSITLHSS